MAKLSKQGKKGAKKEAQKENLPSKDDVSPKGKFVKAPRPLLQLDKGKSDRTLFTIFSSKYFPLNDGKR